MSLPRLNRQSCGWWVLQDHEATDPFGKAYDYSNRPINFGARYEFTEDDDGLNSFGHEADSAGPVGGWICFPGKGSRNLAQWAQVFPAKITTSTTLKATPVKSGDASGWTSEDTLGELAVFTSDGSKPAIGTAGIVVAGTDLGSQQALFFQGGGGGAAILASISAQVHDNYYGWNEVDWATMSVAGARNNTTDGLAAEANGSTVITNGQKVLLYKDPTGASSQLYFFLPIAACP